MFSALPLKPDIAEYGRHVRLVSKAGFQYHRVHQNAARGYR
jgi:hypothetical protein